MSLNGLDAPDVTAALDAAITEPAGWFVFNIRNITNTTKAHRLILRYASRDTVELLGSGKSGVIEARHALSQYPDKSPLYGMLMFRRKRVLIKCIPEGTSRVLQGEFPLSLAHQASSHCCTSIGFARAVLTRASAHSCPLSKHCRTLRTSGSNTRHHCR